MVGKVGFEPTAPRSQTECSTKLSYFLRKCRRFTTKLPRGLATGDRIERSAPARGPPGIRTLTVRVLNPLPLPVGLEGRDGTS